MQIIAISNQKGGTGKTTTVVNLAATLARYGKRVLLVDLDPQGSLTEYFVDPATLKTTIYDALCHGETVKPLVIGEHIHLLPANIDLAAAEIELPGKKMNHERLLVRYLRQYQKDYDYCLLDCPPSLGVLTVLALAAARWVVVPVTTELMAERTIKLILDTIGQVKENELNMDIRVWRILPTIYDQRLAHHREILAALRDKYRALLYQEPVRATTKYKDAVTSGTDISELDEKHGEYWDRLAADLLQETEAK